MIANQARKWYVYPLTATWRPENTLVKPVAILIITNIKKGGRILNNKQSSKAGDVNLHNVYVTEVWFVFILFHVSEFVFFFLSLKWRQTRPFIMSYQLSMLCSFVKFRLKCRGLLCRKVTNWEFGGSPCWSGKWAVHFRTLGQGDGAVVWQIAECTAQWPHAGDWLLMDGPDKPQPSLANGHTFLDRVRGRVTSASCRLRLLASLAECLA